MCAGWACKGTCHRCTRRWMCWPCRPTAKAFHGRCLKRPPWNDRWSRPRSVAVARPCCPARPGCLCLLLSPETCGARWMRCGATRPDAGPLVVQHGSGPGPCSMSGRSSNASPWPTENSPCRAEPIRLHCCRAAGSRARMDWRNRLCKQRKFPLKESPVLPKRRRVPGARLRPVCTRGESLIVVPSKASAARRWLAHLVRAAAGAIRAGDPFDDDLVFEPAAVLALARRHRMAPLLHRAKCDGRIGDPLPDAFLDACRGIYFATLRKNVLALDAGEEVLAGLAAHGVAAAPLKGWALLTTPALAGESAPLYSDPGTRPMDDLDLMVAADERGLASAVLETMGFQPIHSPRVRNSLFEAGHEIAFHKRCGDIDLFVELHWASAGPESLLRGMIFSGERFLRTLCVPHGDSGRLVPTLLGNLLFAALHGARHAYD